jgi:hypothetical protein
MPELSRFFGVVIRMYNDDHPPPHFHAEYAEHKATVGIHRVHLLQGYLPPRTLGYVVEWALLHQAELLRDWDLVTHGRVPRTIAPLE